MEVDYISQYVFNFWKESYDYYNNMIGVIEEYTYDKYIKELNIQECTLQKKCNQLRDIYYKIIKRCATHYKKEELMIGLITLKEYITKNMTKLDHKLQYINDERDGINILIEYILSLDKSEFNNFHIDKPDGYLNDIFIWGRQLNLLEANLERYKIAEHKETCLPDMAFGTLEDETFHDYYKEYERQGFYEKFEHYQFKNEDIQKLSERLDITPVQIKRHAKQIILNNFGFCLDTLKELSKKICNNLFETKDDLMMYIQDDDVICVPIIYSKDIFYNLGEQIGASQDKINAILRVFDVADKNMHQIELSCFYFLENKVIFGPCDMMQVFNMFEIFAMSGYFLDYYKKGTNFRKLLNPCQKKISTYMCYVLSDVLVNEGYKMHMEKFKYNGNNYSSPRAEIKTILRSGKNILKDLGDIDILFLDEYKKQVICVEYKYFQPSISYDQLCKSDRNKITKQVYEKTKQIEQRENIVKENIDCVVEFLGGSGNNYTVKTLIVLSRPNMYVFNKESSERIAYEIMNMIEFCEKAGLHDF